MRTLYVLGISALVALTGCASTTQDKAAASAMTPLSDLNLVNAPIPEPLLLAQKAPYQIPSDLSCPGIRAEIQTLDSVLGADLDTPATETNPSLLERSSNAVAGVAQKAVEGAIPFRGWIRKLSGAERYSKHVAAAITAGTVRRAYLKGLYQARAC